MNGRRFALLLVLVESEAPCKLEWVAIVAHDWWVLPTSQKPEATTTRPFPAANSRSLVHLDNILDIWQLKQNTRFEPRISVIMVSAVCALV